MGYDHVVEATPGPAPANHFGLEQPITDSASAVSY